MEENKNKKTTPAVTEAAKLTTKELSDVLSLREGVETTIVAPNETISIVVEGPAILLVNKD